MSPEAAVELARRIKGRWRDVLKVEAWTAALVPLEHGPAVAVFEHFCEIGMSDPGPDIERFGVEYRWLLDRDRPLAVRQSIGPFLAREERERILLAAGAKAHLIRRPNEQETNQ